MANDQKKQILEDKDLENISGGLTPGEIPYEGIPAPKPFEGFF